MSDPVEKRADRTPDPTPDPTAGPTLDPTPRPSSGPTPTPSKASALYELTKPGIAGYVMMTAGVSYYVASGGAADVVPMAMGGLMIGLPLIGYFVYEGAFFDFFRSIVVHTFEFLCRAEIPYLEFLRFWSSV